MTSRALISMFLWMGIFESCSTVEVAFAYLDEDSPVARERERRLGDDGVARPGRCGREPKRPDARGWPVEAETRVSSTFTG